MAISPETARVFARNIETARAMPSIGWPVHKMVEALRSAEQRQAEYAALFESARQEYAALDGKNKAYIRKLLARYCEDDGKRELSGSPQYAAYIDLWRSNGVPSLTRLFGHDRHYLLAEFNLAEQKEAA